MQYKLDPYLETLSLLCMTADGRNDLLREDMIENLDAFLQGGGEECYQQVFPVWDRYAGAFIKHRVATEADGLLAENYVYQLLLLLHSEGVEDLTALEDRDESALQELLLAGVHAVTERQAPENDSGDLTRQVLAVLDNPAVPDGAKWPLTKLLLRPKHCLALIGDAVERNRNACERAGQAVEKQVAQMLSGFAAAAADREAAPLQGVWQSVNPGAVLQPIFGVPLMEMIFGDHCYYGLLIDPCNAYANKASGQLDTVRTMLKVLGDPTKWEIIMALKVGPRYNSEIAELLGVSNPTASHHMGTLLNSGLVGVERSGGRVYYHLIKDRLVNLVEDLRRYLLS